MPFWEAPQEIPEQKARQAIGSEIERCRSSELYSDEWWEAVGVLQVRGDQSVFDAAASLCHSSDPDDRVIGVATLSQLGVAKAVGPALPFQDDTVALLLDLLAADDTPTVQAAIAYALGHLNDPRGIAPVLPLVGHADEDVRRGVVMALACHDDDRAVDALVNLSRDVDDDVRDWATFTLGALLERDSPQVREALAARLDDKHDDTREEGMGGLALRRDARAIPVLLAFLEDGVGTILDEALALLSVDHPSPVLDAAVRRRWPDGIPDDIRRQATWSRELVLGQD